MILSVATTKGGAGKTTVATNLAVARSMAGRDVLLIDADSQASAADFTTLREETTGKAGYTVARLIGREVRSELPKLAARFTDIIVDVGGRDNEGLRAALTVSDAVLLPLTPSSFDVWALDKMAALCREAKTVNPGLRVLGFINAADPIGNDNGEALELLKETEGVEALSCQLRRRKAFRNAAAQGRSVLDASPKDGKAIDELHALLRAVYGDEAK